MHNTNRVDTVQDEAFERADIGRVEPVIVAGIGIGDAIAAGRDAFEAVVEQRLEIDGQRPGAGDLLRIQTLVLPIQTLVFSGGH